MWGYLNVVVVVVVVDVDCSSVDAGDEVEGHLVLVISAGYGCFGDADADAVVGVVAVEGGDGSELEFDLGQTAGGSTVVAGPSVERSAGHWSVSVLGGSAVAFVGLADAVLVDGVASYYGTLAEHSAAAVVD